MINKRPNPSLGNGLEDLLVYSLQEGLDQDKSVHSTSYWPTDPSDPSYKPHFSFVSEDKFLYYRPVDFRDQPKITEDVDVVELAKKIEKIYKAAQEYCIHIESQEVYESLIEELTEAQGKGRRARALEDDEDLFMRAITGTGANAHLIPALFSFAYCFEARRALDENDIHHAWYCVLRAEFWTSDENQSLSLNEKFKIRASEGGRARSEKYSGWVKREVVRRLGFPPSPEGWKNRSSAALYLQETIWKFIQSQRPKDYVPGKADLTWENLKFTLLCWIREDAEVRAAFAAKVAKKRL